MEALYVYKPHSLASQNTISLTLFSPFRRTHEDPEVEATENMPEQEEEDRISNSDHFIFFFFFFLCLRELLQVGILAGELHSPGCAERPPSSLRGQELQEVRDQDRAARSPALPGSAGPG